MDEVESLELMCSKISKTFWFSRYRGRLVGSVYQGYRGNYRIYTNVE